MPTAAAAAAAQSRMETYQSVLTAIQASAARAAVSTPTRSRTPSRKLLETIFFHPPVQRSPRQAQRGRGAADIVAVLFQRPHDGGLLDRVQPRTFCGRRRRRRGVVGQGKIARLQ